MSAFNKLYILRYVEGKKIIIYAEDEDSFINFVIDNNIPQNYIELESKSCLMPETEFGVIE